jgi:hypothetical protein
MELLLRILTDNVPSMVTAPPMVPPGTVAYDEWFGASLAGCNAALSFVNQKACMDRRQNIMLDTYPAQNLWIEPFLVDVNQIERTPNPPKPSDAAAQDAYELAVIEQHLLGAP